MCQWPKFNRQVRASPSATEQKLAKRIPDYFKDY